MNKTQIEAILRNEKLAPLKAKGQNFLIDPEVSQKIVAYLRPATDHVLEIGPGLGALTKHLLLETKHLTAVEIDKGYVAYLKKTYKNIDVIQGDFLKYNVPRETTGVISNLPYYITTKIIEKVLVKTPNLHTFVFMCESAVSERLFATPGTKVYSPLSILLKLLGTLEAKINVSAAKFYPMPHVDSTVFKFVRNDKEIEILPFYHFLKGVFLNRRKTLSNNLKRTYTENAINHALKTLNIKDNTRAEEVRETTLLALFKVLTNTKDDA